jgi:hypothetical protein
MATSANVIYVLYHALPSIISFIIMGEAMMMDLGLKSVLD